MKPELEFMNDVLHVVAQPVTALRTALELGLSDPASGPEARKTLEDCLGLVDRLAQELAVFREIAGLHAEPPLDCWDGEALLKSCVEEMAPVAEACGVALRLAVQQVKIECNGAMLQRAVFLMLDELLASSPRDGVSVALRKHGGQAQLELRPGIPPQQAGGAVAPVRRQQLYRKLIESAGGRDLCFDNDRTCCCFRIGESLQIRDEVAAD